MSDFLPGLFQNKKDQFWDMVFMSGCVKQIVIKYRKIEKLAKLVKFQRTIVLLAKGCNYYEKNTNY
ncbi:hypothetical protein DRZ84_00195 [Enterococcus faecium]|nr:hypothetical protein DRZ84_00195 [Enterococcus faecium]